MIPMNAVLPAAAAGVMIGLAVRAALPTKPDLASLLDRLDAAHFTNAMPFAAPPGARGVPERVGARLLDEFGVRIRLPLSDLKLLRISPAEHLGKRVLFALYGLLAPQLLQAMLAFAGTPFPFAIPMRRLAPARGPVLVQSRAGRQTRRGHAAASSCGMPPPPTSSASPWPASPTAAQGRHSPRPPKSATAGSSSGCARSSTTPSSCGVTPWDALKQLGEELDIPELTRPADTLALAGDGAAVYTTLQSQARQLRIALLSDAKAQANEASAAMVLPVTLAVILMLAFVMIPIVNTILAS